MRVSYPTRCMIVDPFGRPFRNTKFNMIAPKVSLPHIGKQGWAKKCKEIVTITLDDDTILHGWDCWWVPMSKKGDKKW